MARIAFPPAAVVRESANLMTSHAAQIRNGCWQAFKPRIGFQDIHGESMEAVRELIELCGMALPTHRRADPPLLGEDGAMILSVAVFATDIFCAMLALAPRIHALCAQCAVALHTCLLLRSEERRVGKEC